jgi:ethanolamine utilization protein EutQ (cupin superfamily)
VSIQKFQIVDAAFERSPGQDGEVLVANLIDERHGGPITIGFGRYGPEQLLSETMAVDDVMVLLRDERTVSTETVSVTAGPGEIVYMPKGEPVTIRSGKQGADTAYVTYPHWREADT